MRLNAWRLCRATLAAQRLGAALTVVLIALGLGTLICALVLGQQLEASLTRDARGIDGVAGASGSALQLVLSSVLHLDDPVGNISLEEAERMAAHPLVSAAIPLALGDSFAGARIVGTTPAYLAHFDAPIAAGRLFGQPFEAVLGARVAERTGLDLGDRFVGSHGLGRSFLKHDQHPYTVVGVLAPTGRLVDRLVVTEMASIWEAHGQHDARAREVTALLLRYRTPVATVTLPREMSVSGRLQVATPAHELTRLLGFVGIGLDVFNAFAGVLLALASLSVFVVLYRTLEQQRGDLAVMRSLGATRRRLALHMLGQALVLGGAGAVLGLLIGHLAAAGVGTWLSETKGIPLSGSAFVPAEVAVLAGTVGLAVAAALLPAWRAYRMDVTRVLGVR